MNFPGHGPFGPGIGYFFGAIIWAIGSLITIAIIVSVLVLLVRYLWFGTKASQRYLEINGQPLRHVRAAPAATAPSAAASETSASTTTAPAPAPTTPTPPPTTPPTKPRTPRTPPTPKV